MTFNMSGTVPASQLLQEAKEALLNYNFELANAKYNLYQNVIRQEKLPIDSMVQIEFSSMPRLIRALENVEDVIILDSVDITFDSPDTIHNSLDNKKLSQILAQLKLSDASGKFVLSSEADFIPSSYMTDDLVYMNSYGNMALFSAPGSKGLNILYEADRLTDGSWEISPIVEIPAPAYNPFLLDDGMTLYYTTDKNSLGQQDIMMSIRDALTEPWREPRNLGMPFNSPRNELFMTIDTKTNLGWLATDRNHPDKDGVTLYIFQPSEIRKNLEDTKENIKRRARINSISDTWPEGFIPQQFLSVLTENDSSGKDKKIREQFEIVMPDGSKLQSYSQVKDSRIRNAIKDYLKIQQQVVDIENALNKLYETVGYGNNQQVSINEIIRMEQELDVIRAKSEMLKNKLYRLLGFK